MPRSPFVRTALCLLMCLGLCLSAAPEVFAGNPQRVPVQFSITRDVGSNNEVFVSGTHRDLSSGGLQLWGTKLHWTPGNVWTGSIAIEADAQLTYSYVSHANSTAGYCGGSSTALSQPINLNVSGAPDPPYPGKLIRYTSSWHAANFYYRDLTQNGNWIMLPMKRTGQGRTSSESTYEVSSTISPNDEIEFSFFDNSGNHDYAPAPPQNPPQNAAPGTPVPYQSLTPPYSYRTSLDVFAVQDGQVFNYFPPTTVSPASIVHRFVHSTVSGIPDRYLHIFLPRGYAENTTKRYPVVYFHDGQNVFFPGGQFGCWDADRIGSYEMSQGRMREAILVAIDNGNDYGSDRYHEYEPPGDQVSGHAAGMADKYYQFLRENVLPTLENNYRTINQPGQAIQTAANITAGSSLGGLVCTYMTHTNPNVFGKIGVFSPAFWAAPNFRTNTLHPAPKLPLIIYMDVGSNEVPGQPSNSDLYWFDALAVYNNWLNKGYVINSDLVMYPQCGAEHNERYWSGRLPTFFQFVLNLSGEHNPIALNKFPPKLDLLSVDRVNGTAQLGFLAPLGVPFTLSRSTDLQSWSDQTSLAPAEAIWEDRVLNEQFSAPANRRFWRLSY